MGQVMNKKASDPNYKVIAENRRARYDYAIEEDLEVGIILEGSEVKSMRQGGSNIAESYAAVEEGELWLVNSYVAKIGIAKGKKNQDKRATEAKRDWQRQKARLLRDRG